MAGRVQLKVKRWIKKTKLEKLIKKHDQNPDVIKKLVFIRGMYRGKTVAESIEAVGFDVSTGYRWLDQWNERGYEGLFPKYKNCGRKAQLSDEQFKKLDELMRDEHNLTTKKVHKMILTHFNVDYSLKQVRVIIHKLGYSFKKAYVIYSKMPPNAAMELKQKLRHYDLDTCLIFLLDQVAPQNLPNSPLTICKKSKKNIFIQNPDKFSITGIGLQGINGESLIRFSPNSRQKVMISFLAEARQINSKNPLIIHRLADILKYEELTINKIISTLENKTKDEELLELILKTVYPKKTRKRIIQDLENYAEKPKMTKKEETANQNKLEEILRKIYLKLLKPLKKFLKEEKTMVIVLDNYTVHHGTLLKLACEYLNIILVHLPPYSPKLNPIEQVWRTIKGDLSTEFIENEDFLTYHFGRLFYENVDKKSFTEKWINEYIFDKSNDLLVADICEIATLPI